MTDYWISYADEETDVCNGCCMIRVEGDDQGPIEAAAKARSLGISPGGQACIFQLPTDAQKHWPKPSIEFDRLYTPEELKTIGGFLTIEGKAIMDGDRPGR